MHLSKALYGEVIGLEPTDGRYHRVWFGPLELAILDGATGRLAPQVPQKVFTMRLDHNVHDVLDLTALRAASALG